MSDPSDLDKLAWQRAALVDKVKAPAWYLAGIAGVFVLLYGSPFGQQFTAAGWAGDAATVAALVAFAALQAVWGRVTGVAVGRKTLRFPSGRVPAAVMFVALVIAIVAEYALLGDARVGSAVAVGILGVTISMVAWQAHLRGIRRDLRAGFRVESE